MSQPSPHGRVVLITGASSGIGACTAELFAARGFIVYGASRRGTLPVPKTEHLRPLVMDVTDETSVREGIDQICQTHGCLDILIHAAGDGLSGPIECCTVQDAQKQLDVNYFGALRLLNAVLPIMRVQGKGLIVLIGSVGGEFSLPFQTLYSSSKAALGMLCDGLRLEVRPFGIKASLVEPGDVKTGFTDARRPVYACQEAYQHAMQHAISRMEKDERSGMSPYIVARAILRISAKKNPPARRVVGGLYRVFVFLKRIVPNRVAEFLLRCMYLGRSS